MVSSQVKIQNLSLKQFTAFDEETTFNFSSGINVLIGANATGKSHVMKVVYAMLKACEIEYKPGAVKPMFDLSTIDTTLEPDMNYLYPSILYGVFQPDSINELIHCSKEEAFVRLDYEGKYLELGIFSRADRTYLKYEPDNLPNPPPLIYLPAQEFLSINEGFIAAYNKRELPYNETYYDLSLALNALPLRKDKLVEVQNSIAFLRKMIAGENWEKDELITQQNGRFYFDLPEGRLNVYLVAEGYRKIATLLYLLQNGSLTKDSILFWDEPEANLNPKLVVEVVKVLQMLAAVGMQIFVTTHDYLLSHELSLLAEYPSDESVNIKFFALHRPDRKAGVLVEAGRTLAEIEHNPILEEFAAHYDRESFLFHQSVAIGGSG